MSINCTHQVYIKQIYKEYCFKFENIDKINKDLGVSSVWISQMIRKFSYLILVIELNRKSWECVEEGFKMMRDKIVAKVGSYYVNDLENNGAFSTIIDPTGSQAKGEHNTRKRVLLR